MFKDNLDRILKELKKSKKISQAQIARLMGVAPSNITEWVKGRSSPGPETITKLAEVLDVKVTDLIDEPQPTETTTITNSTFNNSVAINKGSVTINALDQKAELDKRFLSLPEKDKKLALEFVEFINRFNKENK